MREEDIEITQEGSLRGLFRRWVRRSVKRLVNSAMEVLEEVDDELDEELDEDWLSQVERDEPTVQSPGTTPPSPFLQRSIYTGGRIEHIAVEVEGQTIFELQGGEGSDTGDIEAVSVSISDFPGSQVRILGLVVDIARANGMARGMLRNLRFNNGESEPQNLLIHQSWNFMEEYTREAGVPPLGAYPEILDGDGALELELGVWGLGTVLCGVSIVVEVLEDHPGSE